MTLLGLKNSNDPVSLEGEGTLAKTVLHDVEGDNIPALFLLFAGKSSGSYGETKAFSTNGGKALTDIVIAERSAASVQGYMGHDEFEVMGNAFVRRLAIYKPEDGAGFNTRLNPARPSGIGGSIASPQTRGSMKTAKAGPHCGDLALNRPNLSCLAGHDAR